MFKFLFKLLKFLTQNFQVKFIFQEEMSYLLSGFSFP